MMKRRVRAQRKFAAGIQIPNSSKPQQSNGDRKNEVQPESRVFQIHTTPSSMLDVVSFQGIHSHVMQPVVLLKRLKDNQEVEADSPLESRLRKNKQDSSQSAVSTKKPKINANCSKKKDDDTNICKLLYDDTVNKTKALPQDITASNDNSIADSSAQNEVTMENCPSKHITTVKEVMLYSKTILLTRCGICKFCTKIDLTLQAVATLKTAGFILPDDMNFDYILNYVDLTKETDEDGLKLGEVKVTVEKNIDNLEAPNTNITQDNKINICQNKSSEGKTTEAQSTNKLADTPAMDSDDEVLSKKQENCHKSQMQEAPTFRPTTEQFKDPMRYLESILPEAAKFGLCKVIPPEGFDPPCVIDGDIRFGTTSQYIARMYSRWGPAARELCTIRAHLATQKIRFKRSPLLDGREVNLPKLFLIVQRLGGLKNVFTKKKWNRVAEELRYKNLLNPGKKLDQLYVKYLLPYEALTNKERKKLTMKINTLWQKRHKSMLARASNPLHRQKQMLNESESSEEDECDSEDFPIYDALGEMEDCVITGRVMTLKMFKKIAESSLETILQPGSTTQQIEKEYWDLVVKGKDHICVNAASIDTGVANLGFPDSAKPYAKHPWNLKRLSENPRNILSFLGPVVGMTAPTLHLSMVFSTSCWHRDPHGLPWIEYMHKGAEKVWYGIPDSQSDNFRNAVRKLCPTFCQNKSIWLPSDITMIPPDLLQDFNISMCRATQKPGEYIIVCPKAYSCSIATNYTISESVYFATETWLENIQSVLNELRNDCEPTMFSFEQLLISFAKNPEIPIKMLQTIYPSLKNMVTSELNNRQALAKLGYSMVSNPNKEQTGAWNVRDQEECSICRMTLYLSLVRGAVDKKTILCLEHALIFLKKNRKSSEEKKSILLELIWISEELMNILNVVDQRLKGI